MAADLKVEIIGHFECSGELSEWRAVRGVVSGISGLTIYLINNNTGDRQISSSNFLLLFTLLKTSCTKTVQIIYSYWYIQI